GQTYLGSVTAGACSSAPCSGTSAFTLSGSCTGSVCTYPSGATLSSGQYVTATATEPRSQGNQTSEFALNVAVSSGPTAAHVSWFVVRRGSHGTLLRWGVRATSVIAGFQLYAGDHQLNTGLLAPHVSPIYRYHTAYHGPGPFTLHVVLINGQTAVVRSR
ncbi:MAG: hypothetical protein M3Z66_05720, partial [Chloroflexota bacterium]|nr:hypothetical protein [Chloroflexota bacterium]